MSVWEPFGYGPEDSEMLERIAHELVDAGATNDVAIARRAIAAITWKPAYAELISDGHTLVDELRERTRRHG